MLVASHAERAAVNPKSCWEGPAPIAHGWIASLQRHIQSWDRPPRREIVSHDFAREKLCSEPEITVKQNLPGSAPPRASRVPIHSLLACFVPASIRSSLL